MLTWWSSKRSFRVYKDPSVLYGVQAEQKGQPYFGFPEDFPAKIITKSSLINIEEIIAYKYESTLLANIFGWIFAPSKYTLYKNKI